MKNNDGNTEEFKITEEQDKNDQETDFDEYYPQDDSYSYDDPADAGDTVEFSQPKKKKPVKKVHWALIAVLLVVCVAFLLVVGWIVLYRPAVDPNDVPFDTSETADTADTADTRGPGESSETEDTRQDPVNVPDDGKYHIKNADNYNILVVGHDKLAALADVTMIVNFNAAEKKISVMQFPRDTYVDPNGVDSDAYLYTYKINEMFSHYLGDAWSGIDEDARYKAAIDGVASVLEKSLCIKIQHRVLVTLDGFDKIVDAVGGVDMYVPYVMQYDDPEQGLYINLYPGYQHLDGNQAEQFVRFRSGYIQADIGRVNAQKIFLTAFFQKVKSLVKAYDVSALTNLATEVLKNVHTDMTVSDVMYYAKNVMGIDLSGVNMMTVPGNMDPTGVWYVVNRDATLAAVNTYFNIYDKDITDSIFDRPKTFYDQYSPGIYETYFSPANTVIDQVYNGADIDEDSIYIPTY
ncbi:MAG: LCP family protein [Clostridia bacterium]|nr:LCP family protein [Clostridia bacterium]